MKKFLTLAMAAMLVFLAGCSMLVEDQNTEELELTATESRGQLSQSVRSIRPALYFLDADTGRLVAENRKISVGQDQSTVEAVIKQLLKGPKNEDLTSVDAGMTYVSAEITEEVVNVYLKSSKTIGDKDAYVLASALANTLSDFFGVEYTVMFINGVVQSVGDGIATPFSKFTGSVLEEYDNLYAQSILEGDDQKIYETDTILYFADETENYILPEIRSVRYTKGNYIQAVMDELAQGPKSKSYLRASVNENVRLKDTLNIEREGKTIRLVFKTYPYVYTENNTNGEKLTNAALTYTISGIIPVKRIRIGIEGSELTTATRSSFPSMSGRRITLSFPDKNTTMLTQVQRTVKQSDAQFLKTKLEELMRGPIDTDSENAWPTFPEGVTYDDVLGLTVSNDTVVLNMSQNFSDRVKALSEESESIMVYSIVNTLTDTEGIKRVQFLINSKYVDEIAGGINYRYPIIANPGLISQ